MSESELSRLFLWPSICLTLGFILGYFYHLSKQKMRDNGFIFPEDKK